MLITIEHIKRVEAKYFSLPVEDLSGGSREKDVAMARHIAIYISRELTYTSLKRIGEHFGQRDHATIINSIKVIEKSYLTDKYFSSHIKTLI